ncbi:hypothetical protein LCGC14_0600970 [marine sediment metagenome]|uniref:Uncharacterized protein n=1 Tax=marine sediment metagenome TaxID=412755 RepID=A0A0F9TWS7_9ZZZZ
MPKVYIVNEGSHNYNDAKRFGELVPLSYAGRIGRYSPSVIFLEFADILKDSSKEDFILLSGLALVNAIATGIMSRLHGNVNFLIYHQKTGAYIERNLSFLVLDKKEK